MTSILFEPNESERKIHVNRLNSIDIHWAFAIYSGIRACDFRFGSFSLEVFLFKLNAKPNENEKTERRQKLNEPNRKLFALLNSFNFKNLFNFALFQLPSKIKSIFQCNKTKSIYIFRIFIGQLTKWNFTLLISIKVGSLSICNHTKCVYSYL